MCTNLKSEKDVNEKPLLVIILQVLLHMLWKGERPCEKISYVCVLGKDHCSPDSLPLIVICFTGFDIIIYNLSFTLLNHVHDFLLYFRDIIN